MKNKKVYIFLIIICIFLIYHFYNIYYYKIKYPLFLKNYSYVSTDTKKVPPRLYYFTNKSSDFEFVGIESLNNENIEIKFNGELSNRYSRYHNRHQIHLELVGLKPGEVNIDKLTFKKDDGTKKSIDIGNIRYKFRKKDKSNSFIHQRATGSSNQNKDFSIYKADKSLFLKGIYYKFPKLNLDILKVVTDKGNYLKNEKSFNKENENPLQEIYKMNLENKKYIQNQKINIKLDKDDTLTLISFYDFENNEEIKKTLNLNIKAEVIFIDDENEKIIKEFNTEYIPYLDKDDIKMLEDIN